MSDADTTRSTSEPAAEARSSTVLVAVLDRHLRKKPDGNRWAGVKLADLGLDSMTAIEIVVEIEDEFGTEFPEELLVRETFLTFDSLDAAVRSLTAAP